MRPHRRQPTRLPRPWDSPGKNTGVGCHFLLQCMKEKSESKVAQSCLTLSDPMDCSLPGSSIHGIFQARVLEWGAIAFSTRLTSKGEFKGREGFSFFLSVHAQLWWCVWLSATLRTVARQAPLSIGFSKQKYWSGLPCLPPGNLPMPGIKPTSPASPALAGRFFTTVPPGKPPISAWGSDKNAMLPGYLNLPYQFMSV